MDIVNIIAFVVGVMAGVIIGVQYANNRRLRNANDKLLEVQAGHVESISVLKHENRQLGRLADETTRENADLVRDLASARRALLVQVARTEGVPLAEA